MLIEVDIQKLECAMKDFCNTSGMTISLFFEDYTLLGTQKNGNKYCRLVQSSKEGLKRCLNANKKLLEKCKNSKKAEFSICHAGLVEIAIPIFYETDIIGYMLLGHIRKELTDIELEKMLSDLPVEFKIAEKIYFNLPTFNSERIHSITNIAEMFVRSVIFDKVMRPKDKSSFDDIKKYVYDNVGKKLSAEKIASAVHVSKNSLYRIVKKAAGISVSDYIKNVRIQRAKDMLSNSETSIKSISSTLGFSSTVYFDKTFKKHVGMSPSDFRNSSGDDGVND